MKVVTSSLFFLILMSTIVYSYEIGFNTEEDLIFGPEAPYPESIFDSDKTEYIIILNEEAAKLESKEKNLEKLNKVRNEQSQISKDLNKKRIPVLKNTQKGSNTLLVKTKKSELDKLKQEKKIKDYIPNVRIQATMDQSIPMLGVDHIWDETTYGYTGKGVKVAVFDTGIDYTHPALGGCFGPGCKVFGGYDFVNSDYDPMDDHGHGTHVSGTIAGDDASLGFKGIAPDAELIGIKVLSESGGGNLYDILLGYDYVIDLNQNGIPFENEEDYVRIISMSLGAPLNNPDHPLALVTNEMANDGVLMVIAAGNNGPDPSSIGLPGAARDALTVGASGNDYGRTGELLIDGVNYISYAMLNSGIGTVSGPVYDMGDGGDFSSAIPGSIVLVRRGNYTFNEMVINGENAGVSGIVVVNNVDEQFSGLIYYNTSIKIMSAPQAYEQLLLSAKEVNLSVNKSSEFSKTVAPFSSRGPSYGVNYTIIKPDVLAPGYYVCSAYYQTAPSSSKCLDGNYVAWPGTSMATPHVSGIAALYYEAHPDWSMESIKEKIRSSASKIQGVDRNDQGFGLVNITELFDENRTIIYDGSMAFKTFGGYSQQNVTFYNPSSSVVNYTLYTSDNYLQYPEFISINETDNLTIAINNSDFSTPIFTGDIRVNDSFGNIYYLTYLIDNSQFIRINIKKPVELGYENNFYQKSIDFTDSITGEYYGATTFLFSENGEATVLYRFDPGTNPIIAQVRVYNFMYNTTYNSTHEFWTGESYNYFDSKILDESTSYVVYDFTDDNLNHYVFESNVSGYYNSFFIYEAENKEYPYNAVSKSYQQTFNLPNLDINTTYVTTINKSTFVTSNNMLGKDLNMVVYKQDQNNTFYIRKQKFNPYPNYYLVDETYQNEDYIFLENENFQFYYPNINMWYGEEKLYSFFFPSLTYPVNASETIKIKSTIEEDAFNGRNLNIQLFDSKPYPITSDQPGATLIIWQFGNATYSIPSYNYNSEGRYYSPDLYVFNEDFMGSFQTGKKKYNLRYKEDHDYSYLEPIFISNLYNISPGNLTFTTSILSASNNLPFVTPFLTSSTGASFLYFNQSGTIIPYPYAANSIHTYGQNMFGLDFSLPLTVAYEYPVSENIFTDSNTIPIHYMLDNKSFSVTHYWHTSMNPEDANPPSLMDVDVQYNEVKLAITDENLISVNITVDGKKINPVLIGDPFKISPREDYYNGFEDYFKFSIGEGREWRKLNIYAADNSGNWFNQSFYVKRNDLYTPYPQGDFNRDTSVNLDDVLLFVPSFGSVVGDEFYETYYDLNDDGYNNILDLVMLVKNFD